MARCRKGTLSNIPHACTQAVDSISNSHAEPLSLIDIPILRNTLNNNPLSGQMFGCFPGPSSIHVRYRQNMDDLHGGLDLQRCLGSCICGRTRG